jgi:hypothetical protein
MTLRDRNIPAITLRHMHRAERAGGAECKGELSPGFQLGGKVFSLDIPSYRTTGWDNFFGSPDDSKSPPAVNSRGHNAGLQASTWKRANFCFQKGVQRSGIFSLEGG